MAGEWLKTSVWAFPIILFVIMMVLTGLKISGTSAGIYHKIMYGDTTHDPNLIYGHPRAIRSDEWLVRDQVLVSQSKNNFSRVNTDMTGGQDVSLQFTAPSRDWSAAFKPQNWGFFVAPLEYAFAFRWWLIMFVLIVSCYFFTLRVLKNAKLFAILLSISVGLSPFVMWWYQSTTFLVLGYGFLILTLCMRIMEKEKIKFVKKQLTTDIIYGAILTFLIACFGLLFYPPFQISIAVVMLFFGLGYVAHKKFGQGIKWAKLWPRLSIVVVSLVTVGAIGGVFALTHSTPIEALGHSLYPGHRISPSGGLPHLKIFDAFVMPALQSDLRGGHFFINQSEASNFILLLPFLMLPGFFLMAREWKLHKRIDWIFLAIQACGILLFARAFVPYGDTFYKLLFLQRVPNGRLIIGIGFLGILQLIYIVKKIKEARIKQKQLWLMSAIYGLVCLFVLLLEGLYIRNHYPLFLHNWIIILGLAGAFTSIIVAFLANKRILAVSLLLVFTLLSSYRVIPLYRGLGAIAHSNVIKKMESVSAPKDSWVTVGKNAGVFENFGILAGRKSISGTQIYPNVKFWEKVAGPSYKDIYNRQGHAFYSNSPTQKAPIQLTMEDAFSIKFECNKFIKSNAQFALSVYPLNDECLQLRDTIKYPALTFYLYRIN